MHRIVIVFLCMILTLNLSYSQDKPKYDIKDLPCFSSVMLIGAKAGCWDTALIKSDTADCDEYFNQRIFKVINDTLTIAKVEDSLRVNQNFVGVKAIIESDTLIGAMIYMDNNLKGKSAKQLEKEIKSDKNLTFHFKVVIHGDSCKIGL